GLKAGKAHHDKPGRLARTYKKILEWSLNHKWITFGAAVLLLIGSLALTPIIGVSFMPEEEEKMMIVTYNPAPGETREQVEQMALEAEKLLLEREHINIVQYAVGGQNPMSP